MGNIIFIGGLLQNGAFQMILTTGKGNFVKILIPIKILREMTHFRYVVCSVKKLQSPVLNISGILVILCTYALTSLLSGMVWDF